MIINPRDCVNAFQKLRQPAYRKKRAVTTGFTFLDSTMRLALGYFMVVTGYPGSGKSEFVDAMLANCAIIHGWNTLMFSPENYPTEEHMCKIAERFIGKSMLNFTNEDEAAAMDFIDTFFRWTYPDDPSLDNLLTIALEHHKKNPIQVLVFDPWNNVEHSRGDALISEYLSTSLSKIIRFGRTNKILMIVIAHPKNPPPQKDPTKPIPHANMWDIDGGAMWRNKADYGVICHRPCMATHKMEAYFQKIKYKWMGQIGMHVFDYEYMTGRYKGTMDKNFDLPVYDDPGAIAPPF